MLTAAILREAQAYLAPNDEHQYIHEDSITEVYMCWAVARVEGNMPRRILRTSAELDFRRTLELHGVDSSGSLHYMDANYNWRGGDGDKCWTSSQRQQVRFMFLELLAYSGEFYASQA